jgi:hypothetical protein
MATHAPEVNQAFDEISQGLSDVGVQLNAPVVSTSSLTQTEPVEIAPSAKPRPNAKPRARQAAAKAAAATKPAAPKVTSSKSKPKAKAASAKPAGPRKAAARTAPKAAPAKPRSRKATIS